MSVQTASRPSAPNTGYTFSSSPRPVSGGRSTRSKYRETESPAKSIRNLMVDPRIKRGTTVPAPVTHTQMMREEEERQRKAREVKLKNTRQKILMQQANQRSSTPLPVQGRTHMEIQTEEYLEEITDRVIEKDMDTQTDSFMDRPPTPQFVPVSTGISVATQIYPGELFDFDTEVEPLLSVLLAKTMEQSMMEVREEEELIKMKRHQKDFEAKRAAELAETRRLEELERKREAEKEKRMQQERERVAKENQIKEKLAAKNYAKQYLQELTPTVFDQLKQKGVFYDPVQREVETLFVPWLMEEMGTEISRVNAARQVVDGILQRAFQKSKEQHSIAIQLAKEEAERQAKLQQEAELREKEYHKQLEQQNLRQSSGTDEEEDQEEQDESEEN